MDYKAKIKKQNILIKELQETIKQKDKLLKDYETTISTFQKIQVGDLLDGLKTLIDKMYPPYETKAEERMFNGFVNLFKNIPIKHIEVTGIKTPYFHEGMLEYGNSTERGFYATINFLVKR